MPAATDSHRNKRAFQPSIDSFFQRSNGAPLSQATPSQAQTGSVRPPALPSSIQSSLLNVGMRVRKSVPEGYKTHKTLGGGMGTSAIVGKQMDIGSYMMRDGKENFDMDTLSNHQTSYNDDIENEENTQSSRPAELLPFCGLHKVGGMAQPASLSFPSRMGAGAGITSLPTNAHGLFGPDDFDVSDQNGGMPFFSSQESNASTLSTDSMPRQRPGGMAQLQRAAKRGYDEEEDSDEDFTPTFPSTLAPFAATGLDMDRVAYAGMESARAIARPRTRKRAVEQVMPGSSLTGMGTAGADDDFEDADFLRPVDAEVEMGGV